MQPLYTVVRSFPESSMASVDGPVLEACEVDITALDVDPIVNAAHTSPPGGGGAAVGGRRAAARDSNNTPPAQGELSATPRGLLDSADGRTHAAVTPTFIASIFKVG